MFGGLYQVLPSASSPEPLPQEEEKLPQRNANPGIKVCSRSPCLFPGLGPLCVQESPSCHVLGEHLWSQYSFPGPELEALPGTLVFNSTSSVAGRGPSRPGSDTSFY